MSNKIKFSRGDVGDFYEPSDSDGDYTEHEKKLLKKVRTGRKSNAEAEHQVLAFDNHDDDDEDEEEAADDDDEDDDDAYGQQNSDFEEEGADDDGIPDERAWGRKRKDFYSTDFVDQDYSSYNANEEQAAEQEEQEARAIQQRLAKQLAEADFTLDVFGTSASKTPESDAKSAAAASTKIQTDLSDLNQREKLQLFRKDSPEFDGLVHDFQQYLSESESMLGPVLEYFGGRDADAGLAAAQPVVEFVQTMNNLILTYCSNVAFYLVLKAKRVNIKNHPLVKRLVQMRQLLVQLKERYETVIRPQLEVLLERIAAGKELVFVDGAAAKPTAPAKKKATTLKFLKAMERKQKSGDDSEDDSDDDDDDEEMADDTATGAERAEKLVPAESDSEDSDGAHEQEEDMGEDDERRQITYQMSKNKGLTPFRKKELRNPRVKHRNKFRKAIIRRKGAVRTVRKETKRYAGEQSGIKASTKKGIKIK